MQITINKHLCILFLLILGMLMVACGTSDDTTPQPTQFSALDIDRLNAEILSTSDAQTAVARTTQVLIPTVVPTATPFNQRPTLPPNSTVINLTLTPTIFVELRDDDILGNIVSEQGWLSESFTVTDGNVYTMHSFDGSVIMLQLISQRCNVCLDQLRNVRAVAQKFYDEERGYDITYITLTVDTSVSPTGLLNWSRNQEVEPSTDLNWYVGIASHELLAAITTTFGEEFVAPQNTIVLLVDEDGYTHIADSGIMSVNHIRDVLIYYADSPESTETPEPDEEE